MSLATAQIKGWKCSNTSQCIYSQNSDPNNPWQQSPDMFPNVPLGKCPNCYGRFGEFDMMPVYGDSPVQVTVADDAALEAIRVPVFDEGGLPVMDQVGQHYEQKFDPATGEFGSMLVKDYEQATRPLTDQELADLKLQRDQNLDELEAQAVQEVAEAGPTA